MTGVLGAWPARAPDPWSENDVPWLSTVASRHFWLSRQAEQGLSSTEAVLQFGLAVLAYALIEERWLFASNPLLDPAVTARMREEHAQLADDLELLESLPEAPGDGSDRVALAASLARRLSDHVRREECLIYEPLRRAQALTCAARAAGKRI